MAVAKKKLILIILLVIAGVLAVVKFMLKPMQEKGAESLVTGTETIVPPAGNDAMMQADPKPMMDTLGEQATVTTKYNNPGGTDDVSFTLAVDADGVITKAETGILAKNPTSKMRQESFAAALPAVLVGKKLSEITKVDRVGGSSLTTASFNASLPELKSQL